VSEPCSLLEAKLAFEVLNTPISLNTGMFPYTGDTMAGTIG